jgi:hypothetical protein
MLTAERDRLKMELHLLRNIMKAQNKVFPHVKLALPEPEQTELIQMEEIVLPRARGTREIKNVIKK